MQLVVRQQSLTFGSNTYRCAVGRGGIIAAEDKREGDGCTPAGTWRLRECWYRADRLGRPPTALPVRIIKPNDGWCDDPAQPEYNRHITLPYYENHERLWLDNGVYDLIVPLGYNDDPPVPGKGSAIFLHIARPDYAPTEGCVALEIDDLLTVLGQIPADSSIDIAL